MSYALNPRPLSILVVVYCLPLPAFAYIDPGSGMLVWQGLIAGIGAVLVFFRSPWQALKKLFARLRKK